MTDMKTISAGNCIQTRRNNNKCMVMVIFSSQKYDTNVIVSVDV